MEEMEAEKNWRSSMQSLAGPTLLVSIEGSVTP
jgi:hypothetical protein